MHQTEITLVRHGESTDELNPEIIAGRAKSAELTSLGELQSMALGLSWAVEGYEPDKYYSSPYGRSVQSLKLALRAAGHTARIRGDSDLQQQSFGGHEGMRAVQVNNDPEVIAAVRQRGADYYRPGLGYDGSEAESLMRVGSRVMNFLTTFRSNANAMEAPTSAVVFGHGGPLRSALARISLVGFNSEAVDPHVYQEAYEAQPELPAGSQTTLILEGGPRRDSIICHVEATRTVDPRYLDAVASVGA